MKSFYTLLILFIFSIGIAQANSPYGPGYGFNCDPDLGRVYSIEQIQAKANYGWCLKRSYQIVQQCKIQGKVDIQELAQKLYNNFQNGMIMSSQLQEGTAIMAVSSGSGQLSFDRYWVGPNQDYWANSIQLDNGLVIHFGLIKLCGNIELLGAEYIPPPPQPLPTPQPTPPPPSWQPRPTWVAVKQEQGSFNNVSMYTNVGFAPVPNQNTSINLKMDNSNTNNISNTLSQFQQLVNDIVNNNINVNNNTNNNINQNQNTNNNQNIINVVP